MDYPNGGKVLVWALGSTSGLLDESYLTSKVYFAPIKLLGAFLLGLGFDYRIVLLFFVFNSGFIGINYIVAQAGVKENFVEAW